MAAGQWILAIVVAAVLLLLAWWRLHREQQEGGAPRVDAPPADPLPERTDIEAFSSETATSPSAPPEPDDLKRIDGIGPKIAAVLAAAGIATFAEMAACEPVELKRIITAGGVRIGNPTTWPQQAALAAQGRWEDLARLQADLHRGRSR
jgi:predicted flap endonuclease-1-like 5' DNA nuclease